MTFADSLLRTAHAFKAVFPNRLHAGPTLTETVGVENAHPVFVALAYQYSSAFPDFRSVAIRASEAELAD